MKSIKLKDATTVLEIASIDDIENIDKQAARQVLVESFIGEYQQYLKPAEIDKSLDSWHEGEDSVEQYYKNYFDSELREFREKKLDFWIEAKINGELVGWATFQMEGEKKNEAYMNLLIVSPKHQHKGVGQHLVHALTELKLVPPLSSINLLLRKKNKGGRVFYEKLGFKSNPEYHRDNFVDVNLLEPFTFSAKRPALIKQSRDRFFGQALSAERLREKNDKNVLDDKSAVRLSS
jgi:ribosomal protein S18 acetylase RimI-like enzyme